MNDNKYGGYGVWNVNLGARPEPQPIYGYDADGNEIITGFDDHEVLEWEHKRAELDRQFYEAEERMHEAEMKVYEEQKVRDIQAINDAINDLGARPEPQPIYGYDADGNEIIAGFDDHEALEWEHKRAELEKKLYEAQNGTYADGLKSPISNNNLKDEKFLDSKLKSIYESFENGNSQEILKIKQDLIDKVANGPLFTTILSQLKGESALAFGALLDSLKKETGIVIDNANIAALAASMIDNELMPALKRLNELDKELEELTKKIDDLKNQLEELTSSKPPETIEKIEYDDGHTNYVTLPNPEYDIWLEKVEKMQKMIEESTKEKEKLDLEGELLNKKCYSILGEEKKLEDTLIDFSDYAIV